MNTKQIALQIERCATEAIEGLCTQGATADTEHRLTDIRALAHSIAHDHHDKTMDLNELIIKTHARTHAAELAVHAKCEDAAWNELIKIHDLLNDQPELEGGGAIETPPPERTP